MQRFLYFTHNVITSFLFVKEEADAQLIISYGARSY
jgi:hypothetical protein